MTTLSVRNDATTEVAQLVIDQFGTDEVAASKIIIGNATVNDGFVSSTNPLPVTGSVTATVSGVATAANQSTIIGHVDGIEGLLTTIDADTGNVATSVASIDTKTPALGQALAAGSVPVVLTAAQLSTLTPPAAITGFATETTLAQLDGKVTACNTGAVTISAALPAGTNAIGKLAANNGVDIGDVDVTSVPADPFGANADAASATGSISAKLRFIASTGIPITGTVTVGSHAVTNDGTFAVQVDGAALNALQLIDDPIFTDDGAFTPGTSKVMMDGFQADETSTDSVDEGDAGAARMTLDRKQIVAPQPHTQGGLSIFRSLDLDETEEDVKTAAGQVYGWYIFNASTSVRYVKFYNATAANVTVGTTTPVLTIPVPAATSGGVGMVFGVPGVHGIAFDTAICVAATTALADNDTGAPSANDVIIDVLYK